MSNNLPNYSGYAKVSEPMYLKDLDVGQTLIECFLDFEIEWKIKKILNTRLVLTRPGWDGSAIDLRVLVDGPKSWDRGRVSRNVENEPHNSPHLYTTDDIGLGRYRKQKRISVVTKTVRDLLAKTEASPAKMRETAHKLLELADTIDTELDLLK